MYSYGCNVFRGSFQPSSELLWFSWSQVLLLSEFLTSQLWLGNNHLSCDAVINRIRLSGLILYFRKFLTIEHVPRIADFCICIYVFGCKLSLVRLCDSDFGFTPVDDITIAITCATFRFHIAHISFSSSWYLFCLSVIVSGEIVCIRDTYVYQKGVHFLIHKTYVRSIKRYCFVRKYAAIPVRLGISILQYIGHYYYYYYYYYY